MKSNTFFLLAILIALTACTACSSGGKSPSHTLHTYCEGFSLTCQHGGTCGELALGNNQYRDTCTCPVGYEGSVCETPSRNRFLGIYVGTMHQQYPGASAETTHPDTITISANANEAKANVEHLYNFAYTPLSIPEGYVTVALDAYSDALLNGAMSVKFTNSAQTAIEFKNVGGGIGSPLANSWFDGVKQ